jgi:uncharacterized protein YcaQ
MMNTLPASPLSNAAARAVMLHAQGLNTPNGAEGQPGSDRIYSVIEQIGCLQIDTLQVVNRSHYVTLWSRLGHYNPDDLDRLVYDPEHRRLFEYWQHAACIIPLKEYRYRIAVMRYYQEDGGRWQAWLGQPENREVLEAVRDRIEEDGPLRAADFEHDSPRRASWWDWKPAKRALEYLYNRGELMIADRVNFQRVYDLRDRVLPHWVDQSPPPEDARLRHLVERAVQALGLGTLVHVADYTYLKRNAARPVLADLQADGVLHEIEAQDAAGEPVPVWVHRDDLPLVARASDGGLLAGRSLQTRAAAHLGVLLPADSAPGPVDRAL